jgi:FMN reductase
VEELRDFATDIAHNLTNGFAGPELQAELDAVTGSYSGLVKSFFDVVENTALTGRPVLIAATGGTARHSLALDHALRPLFAYLRAIVVPTGVHAAPEDWGAGGDGVAPRITRAAGELAALMSHKPAVAREPEQVIPFEEQLAALRAR